ncbi:helix-turn-helix domain-containing protein [Kibdelosporangium lantanae]|uniref:Helix-turn-helix domain-containing protein n=1 Tax=Kibdelosporangium lantanae TaxID=1497396 RepID=A0ABW3M6C3_9PSEU
MAGSDFGPGFSVGQRIQYFRNRAGMSRPILAGLVGKSAEWLKGVENGRLQTPRLTVLLLIARALELDDLSDLTGDGIAVPVRVFAGERHTALSAVQAALTDYRIFPTSVSPLSVNHLALRLQQAWTVRHSSSDHRTQLGALLPDLIRDAQTAVRTVGEEDRRAAHRVLAGVYRLTDFYVAYQPAPELVWMVADRALMEAELADDPYAIAGGAWAMVQALREAGRWDEAVHLATDSARQLALHLDGRPDDWRGMWGALQAEIAYIHARRGRHGDAWAYWERADEVAQRLGPGFRHVQTSFSQPVMKAHATTLGVELLRSGEALRAANAFDPETIVSLARRSRHLIEVARAHHQRDEGASVLALLSNAEQVASETIKYNGYARDMLLTLNAKPPSGMRDDVRALCQRVGIAA